jgi:hypothetical protein
MGGPCPILAMPTDWWPGSCWTRLWGAVPSGAARVPRPAAVHATAATVLHRPSSWVRLRRTLAAAAAAAMDTHVGSVMGSVSTCPQLQHHDADASSIERMVC